VAATVAPGPPLRRVSRYGEEMVRNLLSVWHDATYVVDWSSAAAQRIGANVGAFNAELESMGVLIEGAGLEPPETAVVARPDGDDVQVTDGPYATSPPVMGGFWIVDVADRAAALRLACDAARATEGPVELRPFQAD
jgi:hypothetical protein